MVWNMQESPTEEDEEEEEIEEDNEDPYFIEKAVGPAYDEYFRTETIEENRQD